MCACVFVCVCVWGTEELKFLKKNKCFWSEERVSNKLKQNWGINHDWSGAESTQAQAIGTSAGC